MRLTRRAFLGYGGATLAILGIPGCKGDGGGGDDTAEAVESIDVTGLAPTEYVDVWRPADLLVVRIGLYNFTRSADGASIQRKGFFKLGRYFWASPALITVELQPQHLYEQAFGPNDTPYTPVLTDLSAGSRIALYVPDAVKSLPLTIDALLDAVRHYGMNVKANAIAPTEIAPPSAIGNPGTTSGDMLTTTAPGALETSLELPWRLSLSPNQYGRWAHARAPVVSGRGRVELWHTRLGVVTADGTADERSAALRSARAIYNRTSSAPGDYGSLKENHRAELVTCTADWSQGIPPSPMHLERLHLSALGGTLDGHAEFSANPKLPLDHWIHQAILGRDAYVEIAERGSLFPYGHKCLLVMITERKLGKPDGEAAYLWRRWLAVPVDTTMTYDNAAPSLLRQMPFQAITMLEKELAVDDPGGTSAALIPKHNGAPLLFPVEATARNGSRVRLKLPAVWVPSTWTGGAPVTLFKSLPPIDGGGQRIWFAPEADPVNRPGVTSFETRSITIVPDPVTSFPIIQQATLAVESVRQLTSSDVAPAFQYASAYVANEFAQVGNPREALFELASGDAPLTASFAAQVDKIGGFVTPSFDVKGLSRAVGTLSNLDPQQLVSDPTAVFPLWNPLQALGAKLFGCIDLGNIIGAGDFQSVMPKLVTDALDEIQRYKKMLADIQDMAGKIQGYASQFSSLQVPDFAQQVAQLGTTLGDDITKLFGDLQTAVTALFTTLPPLVDDPSFSSQLHAAMSPWTQTLRDLRQTLLTSKVLAFVYPHAKPEWGLEVKVRQLATVLERVAEASDDIESALRDFARSVAMVKSQTVTIDWRPPLKAWGLSPGAPLFVPDKADGLTLSATLRGSRQGNQQAGVDLLCALERFAVQIGPQSGPYVRLYFDKLQFRRNMGKKPEIDVVFKDLKFGGPLAFVQTLIDILPLDGFSDPPGVDISPTGIKASYSLALPNVGVGIFSLENMAISAALDVPFVGDAMSFKFGFCSREKPFNLSVMGLGGGGFFSLELTPKGIVALEAQLEFGAHIGIDLGVASGAVSIMGGIYFGWHDSSVSLKGFVRIRGEVDVLGLISASIELYMDLEYRRDLDTGQDKVIGHAYLEIEVSVLFFSAHVKIECERKFAGSNGDPSFWQAMGPWAPDDLQRFQPTKKADDGLTPWNDYCAAFAA